MRTNDVIIIGAGPAGVAAAIQLKRSGLKPIVFEKDRIGGLLANANLVENYPGFPDGLSGWRAFGVVGGSFEQSGAEHSRTNAPILP